MSFSKTDLQALAHAQTLFSPVSLPEALEKLAFVQADPIRAPARAQDLILRHRVKDYRAGDLESNYSKLSIEEDYLYAYGFLSRELWQHLHPREISELSAFDRQVLEAVMSSSATHPKDLEKHFGNERVVNAWGGYSKATKKALENLHLHGLLRVVRREKGIRVYGPTQPSSESLPPLERKKKLILAAVNLLAPVTEYGLSQATMHTRYFLGETRTAMQQLLKSGELRKETIDGVKYLFPADLVAPQSASKSVKFLAPFDPLVWDRRRFEHLWGWPYRFEAYTPVKKRIRGYYALPLLWGNDIIGWANVSGQGTELKVDLGFVDKRPSDSIFESALASEIESLRRFLGKVELE